MQRFSINYVSNKSKMLTIDGYCYTAPYVEIGILPDKHQTFIKPYNRLKQNELIVSFLK